MPRATTPSSSTPVTSASRDQERIQGLEQIARHFLGNVSLDEANIGQIVAKLQTTATDTAQTEAALDVNESFDVHFVSREIAHYSGEFSHWNFSEKLRRKMSCQIDQLDTQVGYTCLESHSLVLIRWF